MKVSNQYGPPALWLTVSCPEPVLITDTDWKASLAGAPWLPAAPGFYAVRFSNIDQYHVNERVLPSVRRIWPQWVCFALLSAAIVFGMQRWLPERDSSSISPEKSSWLAWFLLASIGLAWIALSRSRAEVIWLSSGKPLGLT